MGRDASSFEYETELGTRYVSCGQHIQPSRTFLMVILRFCAKFLAISCDGKNYVVFAPRPELHLLSKTDHVGYHFDRNFVTFSSSIILSFTLLTFQYFGQNLNFGTFFLSRERRCERAKGNAYSDSLDQFSTKSRRYQFFFSLSER